MMGLVLALYLLLAGTLAAVDCWWDIPAGARIDVTDKRAGDFSLQYTAKAGGVFEFTPGPSRNAWKLEPECALGTGAGPGRAGFVCRRFAGVGGEETTRPRPPGAERTMLGNRESRFLKYSWVTPDYIT